MAKAIMISNTAYDELKKLKEENKSFTDVIIGLKFVPKYKKDTALW